MNAIAHLIAAVGIVVMAAASVASPAEAEEAGAPPAAAQARSSPEDVLRSFLGAMYSRDARRAYLLLSRRDREVKSAEEYASETGQFEGAALALARALADEIRIGDLEMTRDGARDGERVMVTFEALIPDANDPSIADLVLGFEPGRLAALSAAEVDRRQAALKEMASAGRLPTIQSEREAWELVREGEGWRVFLNWAEAVEVRFEAITHDDLGWRFEPLRERVMVRHGETIQVAYRAKNVGSAETTGKALHIVGPAENARFMDIVACFCFIEQTLAPGEEVEMPLVFRIDYDAPDEARRFTVRYEFYPADRFPVEDRPQRQDG